MWLIPLKAMDPGLRRDKNTSRGREADDCQEGHKVVLNENERGIWALT
jgi:hypothetical protein